MASNLPDSPPSTPKGPALRGATAGVLALLLLALFHGALSPTHVLFSNDGPLGVISAASSRLPEGFLGVWQDLNWMGAQSPSAAPNLTQIGGTLAGSPPLFARLYAPGSLLLMGLSAAYCFRRMGLSGPVALLGGLAAGLNSNFLSYACWGLPGRALAASCVFVALGLLQGSGAYLWLRVILAGFAVGLNVTEAADSGALLSLYVAGAIVWRELGSRTGNAAGRWQQAAAKLVLVVLAAAWFAFGSITTLINTSVKGVAVLDDKQSPEQRWSFVTGWSLPKTETIRLLIPGVLGYRMDSPDGAAYWGAVGPDGDPANRFSGSGEYAGVLVLLGAAWAVVRSLSRGPSPFSDEERRRIWFWAIAAIVSLMFAFGRHAPFYQLIFPLPFFHTMRIPMKFLHGFHLSVLVLFAHGLEALAREHLARPAARLQTLGQLVKSWWRSPGTPAAERGFIKGLGLTLAVTVLGLIIYGSYRPNLLHHLKALVPNPAETFGHSLIEVAFFAGFLSAFSLVVVLIFAGALNGPRARTAWWILGLLLATDLYRASTPWIVHYDYQRRYQSNAVIDFLKGRPAESRVAFRILPTTRQLLVTPDDGVMPAVHNLWLENHFQYYNIQTVDIIQAPRMPALDEAYLGNFAPGTKDLSRGDYHVIGRFWQLTSTRYVMAARPYENQLNSAFAPPGTRFVPRLTFELGLKPDADTNHLQADDFDALADPKGRYALFEFTGALPRMKLFQKWEVSTNNALTLQKLKDLSFDPSNNLLLAGDPGIKAAGTNLENEVRIESYAPKKIVVRTKSAAAGVLLDNDRWHEDWHVSVDGKSTPLLRANHLMRGVPLSAGEHLVEFQFQPDVRPLYVSVSAVIAALALAGFLTFNGRQRTRTSSVPVTEPKPGPSPKTPRPAQR